MKIPVSRPLIGRLESIYVNKALQEGAISGLYGDFIGRFEDEFADFCGVDYAVSCSSGTAALHLSLLAAGVLPGDEVLVSTLTNMATIFAILYIGARPIPVDIEANSLGIDPQYLEGKINSKTTAIMVVHLFGHPANMNKVIEIANKHKLLVIEDCAEAHGAEVSRVKVGGLGSAGAFSFFANKIISTGEGGMVTTNSLEIAKKARSLRSLAFGDAEKFMHVDVGYNYRMTNIQAAIGCGQMAMVEELISRRREVAEYYNSRFESYRDVLLLPSEANWAKNVIWMYHVCLSGSMRGKRTLVRDMLLKEGVETRDGFIPFNMQKIFIESGLVTIEQCPVANTFAFDSFYLPTGPDISKNEMEFVADRLLNILIQLR